MPIGIILLIVIVGACIYYILHSAPYQCPKCGAIMHRPDYCHRCGWCMTRHTRE